MPIQVQGPDGSIVEFPDGTPTATMEAAMQAHFGKPRADSPNVQRQRDPVQRQPTREEVARQTFDDSPLYAKPFIAAGAELTQLGRGIGQAVTPNSSAINRRLTANADADAPYQDAPHGASGFIGRALPYLATLPLGGPAVGTAGRVGLAAAEGAAYGGAQETRTGDSRTKNVLLGAGLGAVGQTLGAGLVKQGTKAAEAIRPEVRAIWNKAKEFGIELTPAQLSDSRLMRYLSDQFGMLPFSGGAARTEQQVGQFNRKLAEAIGVEAPVVTPEVYAAKKVADAAKFDDLTARNNLTVTPDLAMRLHKIAQEADIAGVGDQVRRAAEGLYSQMSPDGLVPGRAYQALDSVLGRATKGGDTAAHFVGRVRSAIRKAMDDSISPEDATAWRKLRQEYANRKTIAPLVAKSDGSPLPPAQLMGRVTATRAGKERMASNQGGAIGDLARVGQAMKPPPSSGSAERILINQLAQPWLWPGLLAGATAGRLSNSTALSKLLMREGRGKQAQRLGRALQRSPMLTAAVLQSPLAALLMGQQEPVDGRDSP